MEALADLWMICLIASMVMVMTMAGLVLHSLLQSQRDLTKMNKMLSEENRLMKIAASDQQAARIQSQADTRSKSIGASVQRIMQDNVRSAGPVAKVTRRSRGRVAAGKRVVREMGPPDAGPRGMEPVDGSNS